MDFREHILNKLPDDVQVKIDELLEKGWSLEINHNLIDFFPPDYREQKYSYIYITCVRLDLARKDIMFSGSSVVCNKLNNLLKTKTLSGEKFEELLLEGLKIAKNV